VKPEFLGIHLIYLNSRTTAWRGIALGLFLLVVLLMGMVTWKTHELSRAYHEMEQGNHVQCDDGYIAKVVRAGEVTCIMTRLGPGVSTRKERKR
jgi:hypothetical protein